MTIPDVYEDMYKTYELINFGKKHPSNVGPLVLNTNFINTKKNLEYLKIRIEGINFDNSMLDNLINIKHIVIEENKNLNNKIL